MPEEKRLAEVEWQTLAEAFATNDLLDAVGMVDVLRGYLHDTGGSRSPGFRTELLRLHELAMMVVNNGELGEAEEMFDLVMDLGDQVYEMVGALDQICNVLSKLVKLMPASLAEG